MSFSTGLVDPIRAAEQGAGLGIARFEIQAPPYALIAKSSIKSLKDLKGKVISVGGPKDITRLYVDRMLAPHGLKTGDYDYVYAGATTARAQALLSGAVDAAILLPPSNFQLQNQGFNDLGLTIEYAPELAFSGTMANKAWAARNPDVLKRVLAAQSKSTEFFYDERNRAEAVQLLVRVSGQKVDDVEKAYDFFRKNNFFDRTGKISRAKLNCAARRAGRPRRSAGARQHRAVPAARRGAAVGLIGADAQCAKSSRRRWPGSICGSITGTTSRRPSAPAV